MNVPKEASYDRQFFKSLILYLQPLPDIKKLQFRMAVMSALQTAILPLLPISHLNASFHISFPPQQSNQFYLYSSQSTPSLASSHLQTAHYYCS